MNVADDKRVAPEVLSPFAMRELRDGGRLELTLRGTVERRAAQGLLAAVQRSMLSVDGITLDVHDVTCIDSSGLYALLQVKAICSEHCIDLVFRTTARGRLERPARVTRRSHLFA